MYESAAKEGHLGALVNLGFLYDEVKKENLKNRVWVLKKT
jgi:hypothetical protein